MSTSPPTRKTTLLLVDDDETTALLTSHLLTEAGYQVFHAVDSPDAWEKIRHHTHDNTVHIDLILMDIDLGTKENGIDLAQQILAVHDLPIVFLSSHTEREIVEKTEAVTSYGYIVKNSPEAILHASIKMALKLFAEKQRVRATYQEVLDREKKLSQSEERFRSFFELNRAHILLIDPELQTIVDANPAACSFLGYDRHSLAGLSYWAINTMPAAEQEQTMSIAAADVQHRFLFELRCNNGSLHKTDTYIGSLQLAERPLLYCIFFDVSERYDVENQLARLAEDYEYLLREMQHRLKNNMNTLHAMLLMQSEARSDYASRTILQANATRVQGMMLLYDRLHQLRYARESRLRDLVQPLANNVLRLFPHSDRVGIVCEIEDFILPGPSLHPIGLILNELITNTMKYAFAEGEPGSIHIQGEAHADTVVLRYADDGRGLPVEVFEGRSYGFGYQLLRLMSAQIHARMVLRTPETPLLPSRPGMRVEFTMDPAVLQDRGRKHIPFGA